MYNNAHSSDIEPARYFMELKYVIKVLCKNDPGSAMN